MNKMMRLQFSPFTTWLYFKTENKFSKMKQV